jgi:arylsulfatase A-like enzyme
VIVTSDHGMPLPRVKGQILENGFHLPLAMRWPAVIKPGRVIEDFVNVRDFAPTWLDLAGVEPHPQMTGRSLMGLLRSEQSGWVETTRNVMLVGKERHDLGRPNDWGYPVRAIRTPEFLYIHNYHPERWPAGNPETDFGNCDGSPTKEWLKAEQGRFYNLALGFRPAEELYRIADDADCLHNLVAAPQFTNTAARLRAQLDQMLVEEQDPRALGNGAIFDTYQYTGPRRKSWEEWEKKQGNADPGAVQ